jgi:CheY-like chemotaxis protein
LVALILEGASANQLQDQAVRDGMRTLLDSGLARVRAGLTTPMEIQRVLGSARAPGEDVEEAHQEPQAERAPQSKAPQTSAEQAAPPSEESADAEPFAPLADENDTAPRVLLVDDDGTVRNIARALLEKEGFHVTEASDGSQALARLSKGETFSLMVLDLDMPLLGGRDVLRAVRQSLPTAGLPVVVLTGTNDRDAEIQLLEQGADDYMRKPLDPKRFVLRVHAALRRFAG